MFIAIKTMKKYHQTQDASAIELDFAAKTHNVIAERLHRTHGVEREAGSRRLNVRERVRGVIGGEEAGRHALERAAGVRLPAASPLLAFGYSTEHLVTKTCLMQIHADLSLDPFILLVPHCAPSVQIAYYAHCTPCNFSRSG